MSAADSAPAVDWLTLLVCPSCRGDLTYLEADLACPGCAVRYPVVDGVPWMNPESVRTWLGDENSPPR